MVGEWIVFGVEVPDAYPRRGRLLVLGEHVAIVEILPASATTLLENEQLGWVALPRKHREIRTGYADRTVASGRVEGVFGPTVANVNSRYRREETQVLVDAGGGQFGRGIGIKALGRLFAGRGERSARTKRQTNDY